MLFNSLPFVVFLPVFLVAYFGTRGKARLWVCLVGGCFFYGWWDYRFLSLIGLSTVVNYVLAAYCGEGRRRGYGRWLVVGALVFNLGLLAVFKYLQFFASGLVPVLKAFGLAADVASLRIILPLGISFYTFHGISYVLDVYWQKIPAETSLLRYAVYITLFPHLVAGPIVRPGRLLPDLQKDQPFSTTRFLRGAEQVVYGYFLKVAVADSASPLVDQMLASPANESSLALMAAVFLFAFQIYCDFFGYSLIALGLGNILGFDFGLNFQRPYLATSFREFWRRWHISLSSWLRDYLYIPLGGSRRGLWVTYRSLMITMFLGGLWHGAKWTFVAWGVLHGFYLAGERLLGALSFVRRHAKLLWPVQWVAVFCLTCLGWILFRARDFGHAMAIVRGICSLDGLSLYTLPSKFLVLKAGILILIVLSGEIWAEWGQASYARCRRSPCIRYVAVVAMIMLIVLFGTFKGNAFVYFQF